MWVATSADPDVWTGRDDYRVLIPRDKPALSDVDLLSAPVPSECNIPAGDLVNGELQASDPMLGDLWINAKGAHYSGDPLSVFAALTGDGTPDAAAVSSVDDGDPLALGAFKTPSSRPDPLRW